MSKHALVGTVLGLMVLAAGSLVGFWVAAGERPEAAQKGAGSGPWPAARAVEQMRLAEGFQATVFACEPDVVQPISFCIDDRGRLFVAEALNYGAWKPTGRDRVIILEDTDGDGRADSRKLFYEGFNYITGLEVGFGGVWVVSPPGLYFVPDRDGDDQPDGPPQLLFDGFGYKQSRHNLVNGFTWGPDGWLYAGHGRTSPSDVGRPGTPAEQRIHCDGGVYRIHPTRLVFENFADGTTNPWGVDFDDFGACFVSNCVNPHLFHMIQGGHYEPWRNRPSSLYAYKRLPTCADHRHYPTDQPNVKRGETPEVLALGGGHAHCGTLVYLGGQFPERFRNTVFMCNVHGRRINNDILHRKGSGYTASHGADFMISADPWFMGVTLRTGPDGSVFVSDWSDTGECHTYKPHTNNGRIYKISYRSPKAALLPKTPVDLGKLSDAELVALQLHRNDWYVRHARRLLQERASRSDWNAQPVHTALHAFLDSSEHSVPQRLRALWALHVTGGLQAEGAGTSASRSLLALLEDSSEHIRSWAIQLLCEHRQPSESALQKFQELARQDPSAGVRLYLAAALQRLPVDQRWEIAEGLAGHAEDAQDDNLPLMIWYGIEPAIPADPAQAVQLAQNAKIPLIRQLIGRRLVDHAVAQGRQADLGPLVAALGRANAAVQEDLLQGACEALRGRKSLPMPENWPSVYAQLAQSESGSIQEQAMSLALLFGDPQALENLRATLLRPTAPRAQRLDALALLVEKRVANLAPLLQDLLADRQLRGSAIRGLAAFQHPETAAKILASYGDLTQEERGDAVATLAARRNSALALLQAIQNGTVPRSDLSAYLARQLYALGDPQIRKQLTDLWGQVRESTPEKRQQLARYRALLSRRFLKKADLRNGRLVYSKTCQSCHKLYGEGGSIGPNLTGTDRSQLDYWLSNLVDPSAEVGRDYQMSILETKDGRVVTGLILERSPVRLIVQTARERIAIPQDEVELIEQSPLSIMPEGQLETLTKTQVRDLIAYLMSSRQVLLPENAQAHQSAPQKHSHGKHSDQKH